MSLKAKHIRDIKTTLLGLVMIAGAFYYTFYLDKDNNMIFFGLLLIGILLLFAPDKAIDKLLQLLGKLFSLKASPEIKEDDKDIPNER